MARRVFCARPGRQFVSISLFDIMTPKVYTYFAGQIFPSRSVIRPPWKVIGASVIARDSLRGIINQNEKNYQQRWRWHPSLASSNHQICQVFLHLRCRPSCSVKLFGKGDSVKRSRDSPKTSKIGVFLLVDSFDQRGVKIPASSMQGGVLKNVVAFILTKPLFYVSNILECDHRLE